MTGIPRNTTRPAMTPEEWEREEVSRTESGGVSQIEFHAYLDPGLTVSNDNPEMVNVPFKVQHAVAAMALHRQPFGFTRYDVQMLREIATHRDVQDQSDWLEALTSIADRIQALLPPND
jgi:hypothetical protein